MRHEFLLDLIGFDSQKAGPAVGAEIEQTYAKNPVADIRVDLVSRFGLPRKNISEPKDLEIMYDFVRLVAIRPSIGVFVAQSYDYQQVRERWVRNFSQVLSRRFRRGREDFSILLFLKTPNRDEHFLYPFSWKAGQTRLREQPKITI